jgi:hypothetical protein
VIEIKTLIPIRLGDVRFVDLESEGRGLIPVRMMPDLILPIDSRSDGRYSPIPLRPVHFAEEPLLSL